MNNRSIVHSHLLFYGMSYLEEDRLTQNTICKCTHSITTVVHCSVTCMTLYIATAGYFRST